MHESICDSFKENNETVALIIVDGSYGETDTMDQNGEQTRAVQEISTAQAVQTTSLTDSPHEFIPDYTFEVEVEEEEDSGYIEMMSVESEVLDGRKYDGENLDKSEEIETIYASTSTFDKLHSNVGTSSHSGQG